MKNIKKIFAAMLALLLIPALCACSELESLKDLDLPPLPSTEASAVPTGEPELPEETEEPEQTPGPEPSSVPEEASARVTVSFTRNAQEAYDPQDGSQLILSFSYDSPRVNIEGRDDASEKINETLGLLDETYYTGNDYGFGTAMGYNMMLELAQDNYSYVVNSNAEGMSLELSASRTVSVDRADGAVLCLSYNNYEFTGGVHGNYGSSFYSFDTETGERLTLDMLSDDGNMLRAALMDHMVAAVSEDKDGYYSERIYPELTGDALDEALSALLRDGAWGFTEDGLMIMSSLYELGPYAAGMTEFIIPYAELEGVIDAKWLPADRSGSGTLSISPMDSVEDGTVEIIGRVAVSADGQEFCLAADGTVYNVSIRSGMYTDRFYENADLWYCSVMNGSAVQLQMKLPEGLPELKISYRDGSGELHELYVTRDENGAALSADVQAVG